MTTLLVVQHVPHEGLGAFEPVFKQADCRLVRVRVDDPKAAWPAVAELDGIVSMGGPQSVNEQAKHPYLAREIALLREAVTRGTPVLGVCLGAQLLASALGSTIAKNPEKEIGWYPLMREPGADGDPLCEPFGQTETVFQWHGETFTLPKGARRLFSSPLCEQQAFRYGPAAWGLQFHVEITPAMIRAWLSHAGNKRELAALKGRIDSASIARQTPQHLARMRELSQHVARVFCRVVRSREALPRRKAATHRNLS